MARKARSDHSGAHERPYRRNRKRILATQSVCAICGKPVDMSLKSPHPMSATVDHIIPVSKGGHPSAMDNLQLAHWICNRLKSNKLMDFVQHGEVPTGSSIKVSCDWKNF